MVRRYLGGCRCVVEVGTGEGQVARTLSEAGVPVVVGVDPSVTQVAEAHRRDGGPRYARAGAEHLPVRAGSVDGVVVCLVLEHVADLDAPVAEIARILVPGGTFLLLLNHPLLQTPGSGWIDDHILDEQYWRIGPYLVETTTPRSRARGVLLPFVHRRAVPLRRGLARHGLAGGRHGGTAPAARDSRTVPPEYRAARRSPPSWPSSPAPCPDGRRRTSPSTSPSTMVDQCVCRPCVVDHVRRRRLGNGSGPWHRWTSHRSRPPEVLGTSVTLGDGSGVWRRWIPIARRPPGVARDGRDRWETDRAYGRRWTSHRSEAARMAGTVG